MISVAPGPLHKGPLAAKPLHQLGLARLVTHHLDIVDIVDIVDIYLCGDHLAGRALEPGAGAGGGDGAEPHRAVPAQVAHLQQQRGQECRGL